MFCLRANSLYVIIWSKVGLVRWRIYPSLGLGELNSHIALLISPSLASYGVSFANICKNENLQIHSDAIYPHSPAYLLCHKTQSVIYWWQLARCEGLHQNRPSLTRGTIMNKKITWQHFFASLALCAENQSARLRYTGERMLIIGEFCLYVYGLSRTYRTITGDIYNTTPTPKYFNTLRPRQNGRRFADDVFKCIFLNENVWISLKISLKFVPKVPINNIPALVQTLAWCRSGDKPLS